MPISELQSVTCHMGSHTYGIIHMRYVPPNTGERAPP